MAISIRNASRAGASDSIDELLETIESLEGQVTSLYEEKEAAGLSTGGGDSDGLVALYEQKVALSNRTISELQAALASFEVQLDSLYSDRETAGGDEAVALATTIAGLNAQLNALYDEKADGGELSTVVDGLNAQLTALYDEKAASGSLAETIDGLNAQLSALYDEKAQLGDISSTVEGLEAQLLSMYREREDGDFAARLSSTETGFLVDTIRSFEEQLGSFYEAQSAHSYGLAEANAMVQSLEPQVGALLEERNELAAALHAKEAELDRSRTKAKDMISVLMEKALA